MSYTENSVAEVFHNQVERFGDRACVAYKKDGVYHDISWNTMGQYIRNMGQYLLSLGIKKGENIAIFSGNRYEWWVADQSILAIGAASAPVYPTNTKEETQYILKHCEARVVFVDNLVSLDKVLAVKNKLPELEKIIIFDELEKKKNSVITFQEAMEKGSSSKKKDQFEKRLKAIKTSDVATIIYTSGTTGDPKGVMLTNNNLLSEMDQVMNDWSNILNDTDEHLSYLPLSHVVERMGGYFLTIRYGIKVTFAQDLTTILDDLLYVRPTMFLGVPRIFEKMRAKITDKVAESSFIKQKIFNWAMKIAAKNVPYHCKNKPRSGLFALQYTLADTLLFSKLKQALGFDRLKFSLSGGGPLSIADAEFFIGMGFHICEGYGLSETSPTTNVNKIGDITPGSVGPPLCDTTIKISDEGEVLIKGPEVMKGYFKNPQATKAAFTKDGFFKTGDMGIIDDDSRLYITGRIKDIIITAGGKNISPQNIENNLKFSPFIEQVALIGDKRKYISALIIPDFEKLTRWAKKKKITFTNHNDLVTHKKTIDLYTKEIDDWTKEFGRVEKIKAFKVLDTEWSQESGELTPTMKVKRRVIEKQYAEIINSLYPVE
ncbi:MAG: long-chain fatty acid--CoA ligase [bacterium]|nr:long-chain fatty acid--CoA ligase [bacterium]